MASFEVPVRCIADLQLVDSRVRSLCNTSKGAQCQSMLTTEYQSWRHKVALALRQPFQHPHDAVDAFMTGFKLRFSPSTCVITTSVPCAFSASGLRKRKSHSDADNAT